MAYYPDLTPCGYFHAQPSEKLLAVGWREQQEHGADSRDCYVIEDDPDVSDLPLIFTDDKIQNHWESLIKPLFLEHLVKLLEHPWQGLGFLGFYRCTFCPQGKDFDYLNVDGRRISVGANNLFVPGEGTVYVAPSMILHYVRDHDYQPPSVFCDAVTNCPAMRSQAYFDALITNGPKWLARDIWETEKRS